MDKKIGIIAVVAVVIVVAAGAIVLTNGKDPSATILVEDQNGVFFWTEGSGKTIADCLEKTSAGVKVTMTDSSFGKYIQAVNGLAGTEDYTGYWSVYQYSNGEWVSSELGVSSLETKDNQYIGLFYVITDPETYAIVQGGPEKVTVPSITDAKVWDGSTDGVIFALQGESGLYCYINSTVGENMSERFDDACTKYMVSHSMSSRGGISTLFGLGSVPVGTQDDATIYKYWIQYGLEDGKWTWMTTGLKNTDANAYKQMAIFYGVGSMYGGEDPTVPAYA
ncbi:hypothetical protein AUP07_1013 [methanogenic archaeon mixed culture ISO4-G1]|nr:hypothetical protein AUP07_1013 [methanogenic archaeon mixed culture ISO4-G1]